MTPTWNNGLINWLEVNGTTNVVQVSTSVNGQGTLYWWRNELPSENLYRALEQFYEQFPFATLGTVVASCVTQEWSPTGTTLIQERSFSFTTSELNLFMGE